MNKWTLRLRLLISFTWTHDRDTFEMSREKTNSVDSANSIDTDQPKHAAQANPDRHCSPPVDFLFQESLYTSMPLWRHVIVGIRMRGQCRLIWVDTLRRGHNVGFIVGRPIYRFPYTTEDNSEDHKVIKVIFNRSIWNTACIQVNSIN